MTIRPINNTNINTVNAVLNKNNVANGSALKLDKSQEIAPTNVKVGVLLATVASVAVATALFLKHKGEKFSTPYEFLKTLSTVKYKKEKHEVEKLVAFLGVSSIAGGLLGGIAFDKKENYQAKYRESLMQLCNVFTPLGFVAGAIHLFEHTQKKIPNILVKDAPKTKFIEIVLTAGCLAAGILAGNKIGNILNKKVFDEKDKRKIKMADMSPHIDDLCLAASLMAKDVVVIPRLIPAALVITGYAAGVSQEIVPTNKKNCKKS